MILWFFKSMRTIYSLLKMKLCSLQYHVAWRLRWTHGHHLWEVVHILPSFCKWLLLKWIVLLLKSDLGCGAVIKCNCHWPLFTNPTWKLMKLVKNWWKCEKWSTRRSTQDVVPLAVECLVQKSHLNVLQYLKGAQLVETWPNQGIGNVHSSCYVLLSLPSLWPRFPVAAVLLTEIRTFANLWH
jgi:hypothetical protein